MTHVQGHSNADYLRLIAEMVARYKQRTYELMHLAPVIVCLMLAAALVQIRSHLHRSLAQRVGWSASTPGNRQLLSLIRKRVRQALVLG